eukprot:jgi/Mesen1/6224/ME000320S05421
MLYVVGLGLGDERDITLRGLEAVKKCSKVYLEAYTSILLVDKSKLEALYGREVEVADREMVEQRIESVLEEARSTDVAFLVVGDPFGATTHTDLVLRAKQLGVHVCVVHNASIMNAVGACGLQLYRFGETVSIPFFTATWRPDSFYDKIQANRAMGLHTLCLLDIKVLASRDHAGAYSAQTPCVGLARVGTDSQVIVSGTLEELRDVEFGPPLHSFVITGHTHVLEEEMMKVYGITDDTPRVQAKADVDDDDGENDEEERYCF